MHKRLPNKEEKSIMVAIIVEIVTKEVMSRHLYAVGDTIKKQDDCGPIGLQLTGAIARIVMLLWDGKFLRKAEMTGLDIDMYERFIDDTDILSGVIQPGWSYCNISENIVFKT